MTRRDVVVGGGGIALATLSVVRGLGVGAGRDVGDALGEPRSESLDVGWAKAEALDPDFRFMAH